VPHIKKNMLVFKAKKKEKKQEKVQRYRTHRTVGL